ncbi:hypothetical protein ACV334_36465, partial [Pseudomonas aeruginosa]
ACQDLQNENRLINIGIVGSVKDGKSSSRHALVFDAEPILTKAATPITAALNTSSCWEGFQAKVEFYVPEGNNSIRVKASQFAT